MPAGRPKINRSQEDAKEAQRLSKRLYARRIRSQQALRRTRDALPLSPPESEASQGVTPSHARSRSYLEPLDAEALVLQHREAAAGYPKQTLIPWLGDLELLHHFTTHTCYTFSDISPSQHVWRTVIPQIAFSYPFLMRGLLAVSALHIAYLRPEEARRFEIKAITRENVALGPFQELMKAPQPSNCDALFAFASVLIILAFVSPHPSAGHTVLDVRGKATRWIRLIRGVGPMLEPMWPHIEQGRLQDLVKVGVWKPAVKNLPAESFLHYDELRRLCEECEDPEIKEACTSALEDLRLCFICGELSLKDPTMSYHATVFWWPSGLSRDYLSALDHGHATAMIILAYYAVALHRLDRFWWMNGEASRILLAAYWLLDESTRHWLRWPLQVVDVEPEAKKMASMSLSEPSIPTFP